MDECEGPVMMMGNGVVEPPGFEVTLLEPRPFRPFKSSEEYLYAMKEDLAEWLNGLYEGLDLDADNFLEQMETGVILCQHANNVVRKAREYYRSGKAIHGDVPIPDRDVTYRYDVLPETFHARDNVSNFISWCRSLSIKECLLFETDDLVLRKNERSFILCLLEVARRGAKFGMPAPLIVQLEQEIDAEIANDDDGYEAPLQPQVVTNDLRSLHERVVELLSRCTCPSQFPMIRVADGKYRIGDTKVLIFVRILRSHVMVRVGGGWDTLAHYLDKHDPCRCRSGHRLATSAKLTMHQGKSSIPSMHVTYNRPPQAPSSTPSSPQNPRRSHPSPTAHRRSSGRPQPTAALPPCSDDSSTSSLERNKPAKNHRRTARGGANSSTEDEEGSEEDNNAAAFKRSSGSRRRIGRRDLVLRDTVPSSWKYSPGIPRKEYHQALGANGQVCKKSVVDGHSSSRLPSWTPRSENRQPPKVGKVSPRVQLQQNWNDHRSQSSEDVYQETTATTSPVGQSRTGSAAVFHSRGPSPVHCRGRIAAEKLTTEGGFRRNDPKRHSSPGINRIHNRLSPPKPPARRAGTAPAQNGGTPSPPRRMFWSPERCHPNKSGVARKHSAPALEGTQQQSSPPVIEKLKQHSDLCSDRDFLIKIEQLIEEFQARTGGGKVVDDDSDDLNGCGRAYSSLPEALVREDPRSGCLRRSPVDNGGVGKSPSKIPLPTWYQQSKCQS